MSITRRGFLRQAASAAPLFTIVPARVLRAETAPSNQLTRALVGFGGIAHSENHFGFRGSRLVALCDPDALRVARGVDLAQKRGLGKIHGCKDFRDLLADKGIDIIHVCTPPHWHGLISKMAAEAGKDVWCEKPMTRTVGEGRRVMEAVREHKRMFRINTWFRFQSNFYGFGSEVKPIKKIVDSGVLGWPLRAVVGGGQGFGMKFGWSGLTQLDPKPVPKTFDYDLWLGPAPYKPYNPARVHGVFRGYWDYDGGGLGDMGQHYLDPVQYLLDKDDTSPVKVDVDCDPQHPDVVGAFRRIVYTYADGCEIVLDGNGSLSKEPFLRGTKGSLWPHLRSDIPGLAGLVREMPDPPRQQTDFMDSVRRRRTFALNEVNGFRSCTIVNLGLAAMRLGRGFRFAPETLHAVDDPAAERYLYQPMRAPWTM